MDQADIPHEYPQELAWFPFFFKPSRIEVQTCHIYSVHAFYPCINICNTSKILINDEKYVNYHEPFAKFSTCFVQSRFYDDIDRLIMEEENHMNNVETSDESATNYLPASKETKKPRKNSQIS